jgi:copper transport protein
MAGVLAVAASFMFDGHTASFGHSVIGKSASFLHVLAGGVWLGGLMVMAATLNGRRRRQAPLEAAQMAIRFSRAAAAALIAGSAAGVALAWTIIESPADLLSGAWGRLLLVKVALVVAATLLGSYNHFKVVPALDSHPPDTVAADRFRRVVGIEAAVLVAVVAITALLVNAAP